MSAYALSLKRILRPSTSVTGPWYRYMALDLKYTMAMMITKTKMTAAQVNTPPVTAVVLCPESPKETPDAVQDVHRVHKSIPNNGSCESIDHHGYGHVAPTALIPELNPNLLVGGLRCVDQDCQAIS